MASNRCFSTSNQTIQNASDYSTALKQKTMYQDIAQNMKSTQSGNPKKKNGMYYNSNFGVVPLTSDNNAGCLINTQSYELLLNVTKGQSIYNVENDISGGYITIDTQINSNEAWAGNLFVMNYSSKGIDVVVDTSYGAPNANQIIFPQPISADAADLAFPTNYPGVIIDPSNLLFYNSCLTSFNDGKNPWLHLVDVSFNNTSYYQTALENNPFSNFNYPQKVVFACSPK